MNKAFTSEVFRLGGNPADEPAGYVGLDHLRKIVAERVSRDLQFSARAAHVARLALASHQPPFIRRGLQVIGALQDVDSIPNVGELVAHSDREVSADARACVFVLRRVGRART